MISPSEVSDLWFSNTVWVCGCVCVCVCMYIIVEVVVVMCMYMVGCRVCSRRRVQVLSVWKTVKICYSLCLMQVRCGSGSSRKGGDDEEEDCFCGCCGCLYESETEEPEIWIECGLCGQ